MNDHVRVEPAGNPIVVRLAGEVIAQSHRALVVHEQGLPPRYYFPREDVKATVTIGEGSGTCAWKGQWRHLHVASPAGVAIANGAWSYHETTDVCGRIRDHVSFYPEKLDIEVG